jgi:hypothetical protein
VSINPQEISFFYKINNYNYFVLTNNINVNQNYSKTSDKTQSKRHNKQTIPTLIIGKIENASQELEVKNLKYVINNLNKINQFYEKKSSKQTQLKEIYANKIQSLTQQIEQLQKTLQSINYKDIDSKIILNDLELELEIHCAEYNTKHWNLELNFLKEKKLLIDSSESTISNNNFNVNTIKKS